MFVLYGIFDYIYLEAHSRTGPRVLSKLRYVITKTLCMQKQLQRNSSPIRREYSLITIFEFQTRYTLLCVIFGLLIVCF